MAKLLYSAAMSLDGFITGPDGDMSWLGEFDGPNPLMDDLVPQIGAILAGAGTARGDNPNAGDPDKEGAFSGAYHGPEFVLTHKPPSPPKPGVTYVGDLVSAIVASKEAAGDRYVNVLGANVAKQCIEAGELDEILILLLPVMLGDGVRLFSEPGGRKVRLEHVTRSTVDRATNLWYRVVY